MGKARRVQRPVQRTHQGRNTGIVCGVCEGVCLLSYSNVHICLVSVIDVSVAPTVVVHTPSPFFFSRLW